MSKPLILVQDTQQVTAPGETGIINVIAVYNGKAPESVTIQRVFAGEENFKFPTEISEGFTKTRLVYSYTLPQWQELISTCVLPGTGQALKQIMIPLLLHFKKVYPDYFGAVEYDENLSKDWYGEISVLNEPR